MNGALRRRMAVALLAAAVVVYEIGLTRLFSFLLHYHFTFLVVSGAICGLGAGAAIAFFWRPTQERSAGWLAAVAQLAALAALVAACVLAAFPSLPSWALVAVAGTPIVLAGLFLTWIFSVHRRESGSLYFFDLVGASLGTLLVVPALEWLGGPGALLLSAALALGAALWVKWHWVRALMAVVSIVALALQARDPWLHVQIAAQGQGIDKPMARALRDGAQPVVAQWSAYARTDLIDRSGETGLNFYVDGGAGSYMFRFDGDFRRLFFLRREAAFFPYYFGPRDRALIIGPGGGQDVLYALMTGWQHVEGVEVNPQIVSLVRQYGDYNGYLFDREGVEIHTGDGRHYVEQSQRAYDLIALPLVYAEAADLVGYALLENYLFTREAFDAYLDHLQPQGRLALVVHNHALMMRAVATLAAAWERRGADAGSVLDHLVIVNGTRADRGRARAQRPLVLVQKTPYTNEQLRQMRAVLDEVGLQLYFAPRIAEHPQLATLRNGGIARWVAEEESDITPVSDARPFFYDVQRGLDDKLLAVLWGAAAACVLVLLMPLARAAHRRAGEELASLVLASYATLLGVAFMLMEMYLLQRLGPFLGYPTLTLVAALFGLLLAAGVGSLLSERIALVGSLRGLGVFTALVGVFCALYGVPLNALLSAANAWPVEARGALVLAVVFAPGVGMGALFPSALRLARGALSVPWMWTSNGFASVLGSTAAVAMAMEWSVEHVCVAGGLVYVLAGVLALASGRIAPERAPAPPATRLGRGALLAVFALASIWLAAFAFVASRYWKVEEGEKRPRLPVAQQIWPSALR